MNHFTMFTTYDLLMFILRWDNPVYAGMFMAGMFHTIFVYYWKIAYSILLHSFVSIN